MCPGSPRRCTAVRMIPERIGGGNGNSRTARRRCARSRALAPGAPVMRTRYAAVVIAGLALAACDRDTIKPDYRPVSMVPLGTRWIGPVTLIGDAKFVRMARDPGHPRE